MSLNITSLNSGSNGNCYYIGNGTDAIFVDAGITCREVEKRMTKLHLSIESIKAIFISHEHADHIRGVTVLAKKYQLPVFITPSTLIHSGLSIEKGLVQPIETNQTVKVGSLSVTSFSKFHDAADPCSFIIDNGEIKIGVFTDIGTPCDYLIHYFKQCHAAFLESNYDERMLREGNYPHMLKKRISGGYGHLSNIQALKLFNEHKPEFMSHLILSHLSKENNHPDLVRNLFTPHAGNTKIIVASRHHETPVYCITNSNSEPGNIKNLRHIKRATQLTLFS